MFWLRICCVTMLVLSILLCCNLVFVDSTVLHPCMLVLSILLCCIPVFLTILLCCIFIFVDSAVLHLYFCRFYCVASVDSAVLHLYFCRFYCVASVNSGWLCISLFLNEVHVFFLSHVEVSVLRARDTMTWQKQRRKKITRQRRKRYTESSFKSN